MTSNKRLLWLDLETTGLDPRVDKILEIGICEASFDDPFHVLRKYHKIISFHLNFHANPIDPIVKRMHTDNGLWAECGISENSIGQIEEELLEMFPEQEEKYILAGSSVHFDHSFLKYNMPVFSTSLSHRHYDVTSIKLFCQSLAPIDIRSSSVHRVMPDIEESITQATNILWWLEKYWADNKLHLDLQKL